MAAEVAEVDGVASGAAGVASVGVAAEGASVGVAAEEGSVGAAGAGANLRSEEEVGEDLEEEEVCIYFIAFL